MIKRWIVGLGFVLLMLNACGDSDSAGGKAKSGKMTPESLGREVADIYIKSITQVSRLIQVKDEVKVLKPKLEKFKEDTINKLVKLGRIRESLNEAEKKMVDRFISQGISAIPRAIYDSYNEGFKHYAGLDRETGNLIASFNVITQYAVFELLKKQAPEEARRLGIE